METQQLTPDAGKGLAATPQSRSAEDRLSELIDGHHRSLYAFLYSILPDSSIVDDCLQDTYMRAYVHLRNEGQVETAWLFRVGYNLVMDELRRQSRVEPQLIDVPSQEAGPDRRLAIEETLRLLSPGDRHVLCLHVFGGFKTDEIGLLLGVSGAAVRQRLYRARDRFRSIYEPEE